MKVTAESTAETLTVEVGGVPVPARIWLGETEAGVPTRLYVTRIEPLVAPDEEGAAEKLAAFSAEFDEKPHMHVDAIVMWDGADGSGAAVLQHRQGLDADVVQPGDVVQLGPTTLNDVFAGAFMFVTRVRSWGLFGFVVIPGGGNAFYRAEHGTYARVGRATWTPSE